MHREMKSLAKVWQVMLGLFIIAALLAVIDVQAAASENTHAVAEIQSVEKPVEHMVLLGNARDGALEKKLLTGPTELVVSVISDNCLVGYSIASTGDIDKKQYVRVWAGEESSSIKLVVGAARVVLLPGKILKDGPPQGEELTEVYEVRDVLENVSVYGQKIDKICLPVEYRHHFERSEPKPNAKAYVYFREKIADQVSPQMSVVDDFGVHRLTCQPSKKFMRVILKYEFHD